MFETDHTSTISRPPIRCNLRQEKKLFSRHTSPLPDEERLPQKKKPASLRQGESIRKLYRGQQLAIFGRYRNGGPAEVSLTVKLSGRRQTYRCRVDFPGSDPDNPELERLWAMSRIEMFEDLANAGLTPKEEAASAIRDLGIQYQLVTDETSMLVLSDEAFESYGIKRSNRTRIAEEHAAQSRRRTAPIRNYRADVPRGESGESLFPGSAPRLGGGAVSPFLLLLAVLLAVTAVGSAGGKRNAENGK